MEDITHALYLNAKRVCKNFEIKKLGEYHDLYLKSDTLLLADVLENFRKMWLKIYHSYPEKYLSAPGLAWQAALKKTEVKLELLADIDMLLMVEERKKKSYLKYWDVNYLHSWAMWQELLVNNFEWIEDTFQFNKNFVKNYNEKVMTDIFLTLMFNILKICMNFIIFTIFTWKNENWKSRKTCY